MADETNPSVEPRNRLAGAEEFDATTLLYRHLRQALPGSEMTDWKKTFIASTLLLQKVEFEKMHKKMNSMNESIVERIACMKESAIEDIEDSVMERLVTMEEARTKSIIAMREALMKRLDSIEQEMRADLKELKNIMYVQLAVYALGAILAALFRRR